MKQCMYESTITCDLPSCTHCAYKIRYDREKPSFVQRCIRYLYTGKWKWSLGPDNLRDSMA